MLVVSAGADYGGADVRVGIQLEPVRRFSLREQTRRQLLGVIEDGTLGSGDRLPSERELSDQLGVSRGTVREAVQFLRALGLLEVHHGSGTVVSHRSQDSQALRAIWERWTTGNIGRIRELLEVRRGLDVFAAELASQRQRPAAIQTMADAIDQMQAAGRDHDVTAGVEADVLFHRAIAEATGNVALTELVDSIALQLMKERAAVWSLPARPERSLDEHNRIYEAIRAGEPAAARAAAMAHLESVEQDIAELAEHQESP